MKNVRTLSLLAAGAMLAMNAQAGILTGYGENFSSVTEPTQVPWAFQNGEVYSALAATDEGNQYIKVGHLSNTGNNRWSYLYWGSGVMYTIPADYANNNYAVSMDFYIQASNNHYSSHFEIATDTIVKRFQTWEALAAQSFSGDSVTVKAFDGVTDSTYFAPVVDAEGNHLYQEGFGNFLFSLNENGTNGEFVVNGNDGVIFTNTSGNWYHLEIVVDRATKVASYAITNKADGAAVLSGKRQMPSDLIIPTAINLCHARYTGQMGFDNIKVGVAVDMEVPEAPDYILSGVDKTTREYKFFKEGDVVLKYALKDGLHGYNADDEVLAATGVIDDIMMDGTTFDQSGTLEIWTEKDGIKSAVVTVPIVCDYVKLPTPVATLTGAEVGFNKTYQISIDNSDVPTKPTLGYKYAIYDANGVLVETNGDLDSDATNGTSLTLGKGTLELWAVCYGFVESNHVFFTNDTPYTLDEENDVLDFQHYTAEQLTALGFEFTDVFETTSMSGENNWVARCRIYDFILKDGADVNNPQVGDTLVFEDRYKGQAPANAYTFPSLNRYGYPDWAAGADSVKAYSVFPHLGLWCKATLGKEMGLNFTEQVGFYGNATAANALPIYLHGLSEDDMTLVYTMNNYGGNSIHNVVMSEEAAKAANHAPITHVIKGNGSFTINRIDESVAKVEFLKAGNPESVAAPASQEAQAIKTINAVVVDDPNAPVYNLQGVPVSKSSLVPGLYIQNGKLFLVK